MAERSIPGDGLNGPSNGQPLGPPKGSRVARFRVGDDELAVLSFPLAPLELPETLSAAECAVVRALVEGRSNGQIAAARGTSVRTVANQVNAILRKTGAGSRDEIVARLRARRA